MYLLKFFENIPKLYGIKWKFTFDIKVHQIQVGCILFSNKSSKTMSISISFLVGAIWQVAIHQDFGSLGDSPNISEMVSKHSNLPNFIEEYFVLVSSDKKIRGTVWGFETREN